MTHKALLVDVVRLRGSRIQLFKGLIPGGWMLFANVLFRASIDSRVDVNGTFRKWNLLKY